MVTIPKKGDLMECKNYRTIALISHMAKIVLLVLPNRLKAQIGEHLADEQAGFIKVRNTIQQILTLRLIAKQAKRKNKLVYNCFIDFQKAFDSVQHKIVWSWPKADRAFTRYRDRGHITVSGKSWTANRRLASHNDRNQAR